MPTHLDRCAWCAEPTACCNDEHALGFGACCGDDGPRMSFCSVECFVTVRRGIEQRARVAHELFPDWNLE
jgi:hypothetical protein